jgi:hypothetical protein
MSYFTDRGWDYTTKLQIVKGSTSVNCDFSEGQVVVLQSDDESVSPKFKSVDKEHLWDWVRLENLQPFIEPSPWFGKKYRVTPETSALLQQEVFKAGGYWEGEVIKVPLRTHNPMLCVTPNGRLYYFQSHQTEEFDEYPLPEGIIEVEKSLKLIKVVDAITTEQLEYDKLQEQIKQLQIQAEKLKPKGVK